MFLQLVVAAQNSNHRGFEFARLMRILAATILYIHPYTRDAGEDQKECEVRTIVHRCLHVTLSASTLDAARSKKGASQESTSETY